MQINSPLEKGFALAVIVLFIGASSIPLTSSKSVEKHPMPTFDGNTLYVGGSGPNNYTSIQEAIDNATEGDTVFVYDDSSPYYENVIIDKGINLIGENKDTTIIDGNGSGDILTIKTDYVNINGFTVRYGNKGISLGYIGYYSSYDSSNCNISNCNIYNTGYGIYLDWECSFNDILNCNIYDNDYGIYLDYLIKDINGNGFIEFMELIERNRHHPPHKNNISNCNIYDNDYGISLMCCGEFQHPSVGGNTIIGNTIVSNCECGLDLGSANFNTISDNIISDNNYGIDLYETYFAMGGPYLPGIGYLGPSSNNTILGNNISNNNYGVQISYIEFPSDSNLIYHNNFINNNHQAYGWNGYYGYCENIWDNGYPSGGNYWSDFDEPSEGAYDDYHGENQDYEGEDGIVDMGLPAGGLNPYNIPDDLNKDWYPLIEPYHFIPLEITDVTLTTSDPLDTEPGFGWENFSCTVTSDGTLDVVQLNLTLTEVYPWCRGYPTTGDTYYYYFPMTNIPGTDVYYYNTTLSDVGDYTHHIWANDTNGNQSSTLPEPFFLPMNSDVDMGGMVHFMDLIAVARKYYDEGPPGWIREDVDNNGRVHFMDLIAIARYYC